MSITPPSKADCNRCVVWVTQIPQAALLLVIHLDLMIVKCPIPHQIFSLFVSILNHSFLFYSVSLNPVLWFILMLRLSSLWPVSIPPTGPCVFFTCPQRAIDHILAFCHKIFQADLTLSFPHPWNQSFLQAALTPFRWKVVLRSQAGGVECAHFC